MGAAVSIITSSILWMGQSWRIGIADEAQPVVVTGPYRLVRHPIYAGMLLSAAAAWLISPDIFLSACVGMVWVVLSVIARIEEEFLTAHAPGYAEYAKHTGRFLPRLRSG